MDYEIKLPEGQKFKVSGPEGFTQEQAWAALQQQISQAPGADPELLGFDPHRAEAQTDPMGFGQLQRAGAAFAGSAAQDIGSMKDALWSIISDPKAAGKALYELGPSGVGKEIWHDLTRKYGSQERIQKTLETDPFGLLMDVATLGTGGLGVIRKIGMGVAKVAEKSIPPIAGKLSKVAPESLARAGEVGRLGPAAPESAEYTAALRGQPSPIAAATRGQQAAPAMAARQAMAPFGQAGQELRAGGWAPKDVGKKLFGGGGAAALHGALPGWLGAAVGHGAAPVTAAAIAGSSPRLMGATMRGLGATQRGLEQLPRAGVAAGATLGGLTRDQLQNYAKEFLKDKAAKADLTDPERKIVRAT